VNDATEVGLFSLVLDTTKPLNNRVAALFTLKQGLGAKANKHLEAFAAIPSIREFALRAMTDRLEQLERVKLEGRLWALLTYHLNDANPFVRLAATISLARLGDVNGAKPLTALLGDADPIVAHTAVKALIALKAADACFAVVDASDASKAARTGALRVLQGIHETSVAEGLISRLNAEKDSARRLGLIGALARLDHREGFWRGDSWGTRPDTSGPYYQPEAWEASERIEAALHQALDKAGKAELGRILAELNRNKVSVKSETELVLARANDPSMRPMIVEHLAKLREVPPAAADFLLKTVASKTETPGIRSAAAVALLKVGGGFDANRAVAALVPIESLGYDSADFRAARDAFVGSDRLNSRVADFAKIAATDAPGSGWANAALITIANTRGRGANAARDQAATIIANAWKNPARQVALLKGVALVGDQNSRERVILAIKDANPAIASAAREAALVLRIDPSNTGSRPTGPRVETLPIDRVLDLVTRTKGDRGTGERLFTQLNCVNCHTVKQSDTPKGPFLGTIATTYKRRELAEAILQPSKTIAQGFNTNVFALEDGRTLTGFVTKEAADLVTVRDADGREASIPTSNIVERAKSATSVMPEGILKPLTVSEFASLVDYLESLSKK
jgi:putative heme-binding domain-containing protein